jgi:hypothetical protein
MGLQSFTPTPAAVWTICCDSSLGGCHFSTPDRPSEREAVTVAEQLAWIEDEGLDWTAEPKWYCPSCQDSIARLAKRFEHIRAEKSED